MPDSALPNSAVVTHTLQRQVPDFVKAEKRSVGAFESFNKSNDPDDCHDFGALHLVGQRLYFKIDLFEPVSACRWVSDY